MADYLRQHDIEPEFADRDYVVLMLTPDLPTGSTEKLKQVFRALPRKEACRNSAPKFEPGERVMPIRAALLSASEICPAEQCLGRVLAVPTVGCPPAVPILVSGEKITEHVLSCFSYYGIGECCVVRDCTNSRAFTET